MATGLNTAQSACTPVCCIHRCYSNQNSFKSLRGNTFFHYFLYHAYQYFFFNFKNSPKIQIAIFLVSEHNPYRGPPGAVFCQLTIDLLKNCRRSYSLKKLFTTLQPDQPMAKPQFAFQANWAKNEVRIDLTETRFFFQWMRKRVRTGITPMCTFSLMCVQSVNTQSKMDTELFSTVRNLFSREKKQPMGA